MNQLRLLFVGMILCASFSLDAQLMHKPSQTEIDSLPLWAQKMYSSEPNLFEIDSLYANYYRHHLFVKSYHTQYYKRWRRSILNWVSVDGEINLPTAQEMEDIQNQYLSNQHTLKASNWSLIGPVHTQQELGEQGREQANVYSIDQCAGQPNFMYLGTEPGEVYKSMDGGNNWTNTSMNENFGSGVTAVEVHPSNGNIVFAGGNSGVFRSIDGGSTWINVLPNTNFGVNEILINPGNDQIVLAATDKGLYRSTDGGTNWIQLFTQATYDVKANTVNSSIVYLLKNNPSLIICEFYSSTDFGATWSIQSNGWYSSSDPARLDGGGRLAVTPADPNRVYAYLIGESKANDYGYIGVYKSIDGGGSWTLPNSPAGGPYTTAHLNLAYGEPSWTYHQGFYNCAIVASALDPDDILVGGLNLYRSNDAGTTFQAVSGYVGGPLNLHVDNQDFRQINGNTWITTDGGAYLSTDFFNTEYLFKMDGVHGSDYWGFGSGWNEDVLVGGLYHNGNLAYYENYGPGNFLALGGGEAPTGYVNPGNNRKTYFSDIGGAFIPLNLNDPINWFGGSLSPNESYWAAESSEMEFHPNCYNIAFIGKENKLWKTEDGGGSYSVVKTFGTNVNDVLNYIEIASSNPNTMYVTQRPASGNSGTLWRTTNAGIFWSPVTIPSGNSRRILITINPMNENELWMAYPSGSNGNKVFHTVNGGGTWTNITSPILNNESIQSLVYIAGTGSGIYAGTARAIYYYNNASGWTLDNSGLPTFTNTNILKPFYRDGKIRTASYGKGIWESNLNEQPAFPLCRITVDKLEQTVFCELDSFYFEDYSFLNHTNASWEWQFPTGTPSSSTLRNPSVLFANSGSHLAVLTITDQYGNIDQDSLYVTVSNLIAPQFVNEDFQGTFLPDGWFQTNEDNGGAWNLSTSAGGYGTSTQSTIFDNFYNDSQGSIDDLNIPINTFGINQLTLSFDVAYAPYGGQYSDTLEVLVSTDCGSTFTTVFQKGGNTLATAANFTDYYIPASNEWRTETIDLSPFTGEQQVVVAFRNHGYYGNVIYVDNINIENDLGIEQETKQPLNIYPNPVCAGENIYLETPEEVHTIRILDAQGKVAYQSREKSSTLRVPLNLKSGVYWMNLESDNHIWNTKLVIH